MKQDRTPSAQQQDRRTFLKQGIGIAVAAPMILRMSSNGSRLCRGWLDFSASGRSARHLLLPGIDATIEPAAADFGRRGGRGHLFKENISSSAQIAGVVQQLRDAQAQSPVGAPLLLMTDQEGGLVRRLPGEPTLSAKQIGQSTDPAAAGGSAGTGAGQNLASVGMNVNLAPVLDVFYTSGNFIDATERSFSSSASTVSACVPPSSPPNRRRGSLQLLSIFPASARRPSLKTPTPARSHSRCRSQRCAPTTRLPIRPPSKPASS